MAAHPFLRFWQAPGFAGRFFCFALCSGHIGVFHTAAGFIWGKRGGKCVKLQAAQHNRYKAFGCAKKGKQADSVLSFLLFYDFCFCLRSFFRQWAQRLQLSQPVQPQLLRRIKARTARNSAVPMAASSRMSQIFTAALRSRGSQRQPPTQSNTATAPARQPTCRPVPAARRPPPPRRGCTAG